VIVVAGYSFRDKAINTRLIEWIYGNCERRLVIVHGQPNDLICSARPAIVKNLSKWKEKGSVKFIEKWIQETDWNDVLEALNKQH
jgi:hypothetical protein